MGPCNHDSRTPVVEQGAPANTGGRARHPGQHRWSSKAPRPTPVVEEGALAPVSKPHLTNHVPEGPPRSRPASRRGFETVAERPPQPPKPGATGGRARRPGQHRWLRKAPSQPVVEEGTQPTGG